MIRTTVANIFWKISRWKLVTEPAPRKPTIFVAAPRTSNWDFVLMLAIAWKLGLTIRWVGKDSLFNSVTGPFLRSLGGISVDRDNPGKIVEELSESLSSGRTFALVITPDGTRTNTGPWKSGFYRIAMETGLPVTLGYVDRTTMSTGLGPTFHLTGDQGADMDRIREFFKDKAGFHPSRRAEPRLAGE